MNPGLNLNNLKYFYDAVECQSVSESARKNYITQSAVSQAILKLEKALKVNLITHQRNFFKLTAEGEIVFSLTQQLFSTLKALQEVAQEQTKVISGQVSLACTQSIAVNIISNALKLTKEKYPQIKINLKICKMEQICLLLKRGVMDIGIAVESAICESYQKEEIRKGNFYIYEKNDLSPNQGYYVDHMNGLFVDKLMQLYYQRFKKEIMIMQELDSWQVLAKCASQGIGKCFLPDFIAAGDSTLKIDETLMSIPYRVVAFYPQGMRLTRATSAFIDVCKRTGCV